MSKIVLKARYGTELRKNWVYHNNDMSLNDLITKMQRYFDIKDTAASTMKIKYRDEENDWITLTNDDDLYFALTSMELLFVDVLVGADIPDKDDNEKQQPEEKEKPTPPPVQQQRTTPTTMPPLPIQQQRTTTTPTTMPPPPIQQQQQFDGYPQYHQQASHPQQIPSQPTSQFAGMGGPMLSPSVQVNDKGGIEKHAKEQPTMPPVQQQQTTMPPPPIQQQQQFDGYPQYHQQVPHPQQIPSQPTSQFGGIGGPMPPPPIQQQQQFDGYPQYHQQVPHPHPQQIPSQPTSQFGGIGGPMPPPPPISSVVGSTMSNPFSRQQRM